MLILQNIIHNTFTKTKTKKKSVIVEINHNDVNNAMYYRGYASSQPIFVQNHKAKCYII